MSVTRETLYNEVWAEPMTTVAARYTVSSSFLARVCERLGVPRPPRGYWAQLQVGKGRAQSAKSADLAAKRRKIVAWGASPREYASAMRAAKRRKNVKLRADCGARGRIHIAAFL